MKKSYLLLYTIAFFAMSLNAQVSIKDSSVATPMISASYGYYLSGGDMNKRFGNNSSIQLNVDFKTRYNWIIGINGSYIFGKTVKESLFDSIASPNGYIIDKLGGFADVRLYERGFTTSVTLGRIFPFKKPNPNSGIVFNIGLGFIQHKIRIETIGNNVPQLSKEYKKGYDRLSNGFLLSQNLGYMYLSNNRIANFYFGLECMQGFTQNRRSYNFDEMKQDTEKRIDIFYGAKVSWILPLYKKAPKEFYTY
jgi:hypothetical protein